MAGFLVSSVNLRDLIDGSTLDSMRWATRFEARTRISASITSNPSRISLIVVASNSGEKSGGGATLSSAIRKSKRPGCLRQRSPKMKPMIKSETERAVQRTRPDENSAKRDNAAANAAVIRKKGTRDLTICHGG